jgi:aerobic-type carbon monoxide dehydrogenase small subunit (CoxS/CutS family)
MTTIIVNLHVNCKPYSVRTSPERTLLQLLRDDLGFSGVKDGCREGECGACTVLFDGLAMNSCLILAGQATGHEVITIEGLANGGDLHPVQKAFIESGAIQCGFCSPGFILSTVALLDRNPEPSSYEIKEALSGNICRCTGYAKIIDAVDSVISEMKQNA